MAKHRILSTRVDDDWYTRIVKACEKLGYIKGEADKGVSQFMRQAAIDKANKVLGLRSTLPMHVETKDQH